MASPRKKLRSNSPTSSARCTSRPTKTEAPRSRRSRRLFHCSRDRGELLEPGADQRPVHQFLNDSTRELLALVLVVEIIGVLPDVARQKRLLIGLHRLLGIVR